MPRKPQQDRARATVEAIVQAGFIVLSKEGPKGTTTRKIADAAGIGVGSLYEYFAHREAIFEAMLERIVLDAVTAIQPSIPELVRMPIREAVFALLMRLREVLVRDDERYLRCVRHAQHLAPRFSIEPLRRVLTDLVVRYVMQHPEQMAATQMPAMSYIFVHGGTFTVISHLVDPTPPVTFEELARGLASMVARCSVEEGTRKNPPNVGRPSGRSSKRNRASTVGHPSG